jgi:hypothetical protein
MRWWTRIIAGGAVFVALLASTSSALATPAVDQYSEGIPTAGGQKSSRGAVGAAGTGAISTIPPSTQAQLRKSKKGTAAARVAQITAPKPSDPGSAGAGGLGLILPLILVSTLLAGLTTFVARRRQGATSA